MPQCITSRDNEKVKHYKKLSQSGEARRSEGCFTAEGLRLCSDLAKKLPLKELFVTQQALDKNPQLAQLCDDYCIVAAHVADKLSATQSPQGVFGVFAMPAQGLPAQSARLLLLENVQDAGNVGALLRSAAAFGFEGVALSEGCADPFSPKAVRASMSAVGALRILQGQDMPALCAKLREQGVFVMAAALSQSVPLSQADTAGTPRLAVLIGNEGNGLTPQAVQAADIAVRIPMSDAVESLNAAAAGAVLLWHCRRSDL